MAKKAQPQSKREARAEINKLMDEFLAKGGKIKVIKPKKRIAPKYRRSARKTRRGAR